MSNEDIPKSLAFTLGMARYKVEDDGTIVITDQYDWNAPKDEVEKLGFFASLGKIAEGAARNGLLGVGNVVGNLVTGGGGGGRKVEIRIPPKKKG